MKRKLFYPMVMLFVFGFMSSCQDKVDEATTDLVGSFTCTINSVSWTGKITAGSSTNGNLVITSTKDKQLVTLNFDTLKVGKRSLSFSNNAIFTSNTDSISTTSYSGISVGEIEITSIDATNKKVSGTFHFEGFNATMSKATITSGVFKNINYQ
jgi:hypothetical protein